MTALVPIRLRRRLHARVTEKSGRRNVVGGVYQALASEPLGLTYAQLTQAVYGTDTPTASQYSVVQHAVTELTRYDLVTRRRPGTHVLVTRTDLSQEPAALPGAGGVPGRNAARARRDT
jgi:hypothetical protein